MVRQVNSAVAPRLMQTRFHWVENHHEAPRRMGLDLLPLVPAAEEVSEVVLSSENAIVTHENFEM